MHPDRKSNHTGSLKSLAIAASLALASVNASTSISTWTGNFTVNSNDGLGSFYFSYEASFDYASLSSDFQPFNPAYGIFTVNGFTTFSLARNGSTYSYSQSGLHYLNIQNATINCGQVTFCDAIMFSPVNAEAMPIGVIPAGLTDSGMQFKSFEVLHGLPGSTLQSDAPSLNIYFPDPLPLFQGFMPTDVTIRRINLEQGGLYGRSPLVKGQTDDLSVQTSIPAPGTITLLGLGALLGAVVRRRPI